MRLTTDFQQRQDGENFRRSQARKGVLMKALIAVAALALSALTLGQNPSNLVTITVTVNDTAGAVIPGVKVTASGPGGVTSGVTDLKGSVDLRVTRGVNQVTAALPGFASQTREIPVEEGGQFLMTLAPRPTQAQPGPSPFERRRNVDIQADNITRQGNLVLYRGNVRMKTDSIEMRADELDFNTVTRNAGVRGNVTVQLLPVNARMIPVAN
jgi:hypothetical protein